MTPLLTLPDLRVWTREAIDDPDDITFAEFIIEAASLRVSEEAAFGSWVELDTPSAKVAKSIATQVAKRAYLNPDQEMRTAAIGPIGGVGYHADFASGLQLTASEMERLAKIAAREGAGTGKGIWTMRINREDRISQGPGDVVVNDSAGSGIIYGHESDANYFSDIWG